MALKKGHKPTAAMKKAGEKNLKEWLEKHPERGAVKHGAYSLTTRKRYTDLRTVEGRHLQNVINNIKDDLGNDLDQRQLILLDRIKEKLIVLMQIGDYINRQPSVIKDDALISCLGSGYVAFDNSLTRTLTLLYEAGNKKPSRVPTIKEIVSKNEHNKSDQE